MRDTLENMFETREKLYAQADIHIDNSSGQAADAVYAIEYALADFLQGQL